MDHDGPHWLHMDYIVYTLNLRYYEHLRDALVDAHENGLTFERKQAIDMSWHTWCQQEYLRLRNLRVLMEASKIERVPPYSALCPDNPDSVMCVHAHFQLIHQQCMSIFTEHGLLSKAAK